MLGSKPRIAHFKIYSMNNRIVGFDLARAYAIFGMFIVNFNTVFGSHNDNSLPGKLLALFNGNSSSTFVILAGMGVSLMTNRATYQPEEKRRLQSIIIKRSWFLFFSGLFLFLWWPADILHFYGGYMHLAALILFSPKKYYLLLAALAIVVFHTLFLFIPFENGWNFDTLQYTDFWTLNGFFRNTFYNGWNSIFPWIAYFLFGMWLGRLDWQDFAIRKKLFLYGFLLFSATELLQLSASTSGLHKDLIFYLTADYLPPFLPFMLSTTGFALMLLVACMYFGNRFASYPIVSLLSKTGQMTLTHYVSHLTIGFIMIMVMTGKAYTGVLDKHVPVEPIYILLFAITYFIISLLFSKVWSSKFKNGPLETLMRKISG